MINSSSPMMSVPRCLCSGSSGTRRVAKNTISEEINRRAALDGATFADVAQLASGVRGRERVLQRGEMEDGMWWAGQSQGLINSIDSCERIVAEIVRDATGIIAGLNSLAHRAL